MLEKIVRVLRELALKPIRKFFDLIFCKFAPYDNLNLVGRIIIE